ncbi:MAG TPA: ABC transporter permease [Bryobacteraceae bacterium]|nr:ABC transporter permease [Bryobacteraceae bacterium]
MNTVALFEAFVRNLRHALRGLRHNPAFTAAALLTLALGIGANTAVFSVIDSVLLRPLPYPHPEQLVALRQLAPGAVGLTGVSDGLLLSSSMYFTYAGGNRAFRSLGVFQGGGAVVAGLAEPEQVRAVFVSDGVLETLRVQPALGRWIGPADQKPGAQQTVMLSHGYLQRRFGGSRSALGRSLSVDSQPHAVVGVMPPGFRVANMDFDLILPLQLDPTKRSVGLQWRGIARLKPDATVAQANADLARLLPIWQNSPIRGEGPPNVVQLWRITPALRPLKDDVVRDVGTVLGTAMATIGAVILIAGANVANLLLVRAEARRQELAIRAALGAGWGRIVRELLIESVLLGLMGGALGVGVAFGGLRLLVAAGPANLPRLHEISLDGRALAFTFVLSLISALLFGSIPAFKYAGRRIALGGRTFSAGRERRRTRNVLVVAQVALAVVLLISSGLMIRTFQALHNVEPGFTHPEQIQAVRIAIPRSQMPDEEQVRRTQNAILDKLAAIPGVASAGFVTSVPLERLQRQLNPILAESRGDAAAYRRGDVLPTRSFKYVSPGYLGTMGAKLVLGRDLAWADIYNHRRFALVSENLAREVWGSPANALGQRFVEIAGKPWYEVIGVVQDVRDNGVDHDPPAIVYWPALLDYWFFPGPRAWREVAFVVRSDLAGTESLVKQIQQAVWSVNGALPVASPRTMQEIYSQSMAQTSFTLVMLAIAGAMALLLGLVGIYGVIAYAVSQRRREIGVRLALGAAPGNLKRLFVRRGLVLAGIGVTIGLPASAGLTRLLKSLLFGISPLDPPAFAAAAAVLVLAAVLASFLPARRATTVDPVEALKAE